MRKEFRTCMREGSVTRPFNSSESQVASKLATELDGLVIVAGRES